MESKKTLPLAGEIFEVAGCEAFLIRAESAPEQSAPWVWYAPTLPQYPDKNEAWMFGRFVEAGISIAGIDVGESWGSPEGRRQYSTLYRYLTETLNFGRRPALLPRSRGGLMLYNWAAENPGCVSCVAGIYPVCQLCEPWLELAVESYGQSEEAIVKALSHHCPTERLDALAEASVPIYHIHGDVDEIVPLEDHSALLAERYAALGGQMTVNVAKGHGHSVWEGFFRDEKLVAFVIDEIERGEGA